MKIVVTGAAGLIGSRICQWIIDNVPDARVSAVDDLSGGFADMSPAQPAPVPDKATPDYVTTIEVLRARIAALESAAPVPVPLTDEQIASIVYEMNGNEPTAPFWRDLARAIIAASHGIAASPEKP
jgi:nucleoside-diphosphate-sugar epimerase